MIRKLFTLFAVALLLTGCRSDEPFGADNRDGSTTLELLVPDTRMSRTTRAEKQGDTRANENPDLYNVDATEATISTLRLFAFTGEGTNKHFYSIDLTNMSGKVVSGIYKSYTLHLAPGEYDLYLLANIEPSTTLNTLLKAENPSASAIETEVKGMLLDFGTSGASPATPGRLPMAWKDKRTVSKGTNATVTANLKFCVSKVRLTILYDNAFGSSNYLAVDAANPLTGLNVYSESKVYPETADKGAGKVASWSKVNEPGQSVYRNYPDIDDEDVKTPEQVANYLVDWFNSYSGESELTADPLVSGSVIADFDASKATASGYKYVYQTVAYLPEALTKSEDDASKLQLNGLKCSVSGNTTAGINSGTDQPYTVIPGDVNGSNYSLQRGYFYDIVGYVNPAGNVTFKLIAKKLWDAQQLNVALAGTTYLDVAQTEITETISGEKPYYLGYSTDAPVITFESEKDSSNKNYFSLSVYTDPDTGEKSIEVAINPESNATGTQEDKYFYIIAGNLKKKIVVKTADYSTYLRLTPATRTLSIPKIINEAEYTVYFNWSTNEANPVLSLTSVSSTVAGKADAMTIGFEQLNENGDWEQIPGTATTSLLVKQYKPSGNSLPKQGRIAITVKNPANPNYFTVENVIKIKAVTDNTTAGKFATLTVSPNPTKYRVYFKDVNWNKDWDNPHVYAYQPLEMWDPLNQNYISMMDTQGKVDWIEYSFTGNVSFKGWTTQGGIASPADFAYVSADGTEWAQENYIKQSEVKDKDAFNNKRRNLRIWQGDAGHPEKEGSKTYYDFSTELLPGWRSGTACPDCNGNKVVSLWPGVAMKKDTSTGWWYIDLPLLAKPGKTLLMFANGHSGAPLRFPGDKVPGVILPNYSDREAWYLCNAAHITGGKADDHQSTTNEFSDDKPAMPSGDEFYVVRWVASWAEQLHMWYSASNLNIIGEWNNDEQTGIEYSGYRYLYIGKQRFKNDNVGNDSDCKYKLHNGDQNQSSADWEFKGSNIEVKTVNDLPTALKNRIGSNNTILGVFEIKKHKNL